MDIIIYITAALCVAAVVLLIILIAKKPGSDGSVELLKQQLSDSTAHTSQQLNNLLQQMQGLTEKNYQQQIALLKTLDENTQRQTKAVADAIGSMQESNEKKLELMRKTVDEKLTETLNTRLNSSFKTVSEQLSNVYKSLGEMKELSAGVTTTVSGLNRVLSNVKARGTWAEVQLGVLLDQTIPGMYDSNVQTNPGYNGRVEFAVRIPNQENGGCTYLPIDSKFPIEDYIRLTDAAEIADSAAMESARKSLETRIRDEAKNIQKYINPPETTPFAILYLATEGLYAEIISSKSGIGERLQSQGIMLAGPGTITALLNSLAMGFRTMAINEKANEVWKILGAAKTQYDKFGDLLAKARKKVDDAGKALDEADRRNTLIQKNLKSVETLDAADAKDILGIE